MFDFLGLTFVEKNEVWIGYSKIIFDIKFPVIIVPTYTYPVLYREYNDDDILE